MSDFAKDTNVPINDCISRQAAVDAIVNRETTTTRGTEYLDGYAKCQHDILDIIDQLPSAQQWIPVTERLPEPYCGAVLVTVNDGSVYVDVMSYDSPGDGHTYNSMFYTADSDGYPEICEDVVAWMPLPKPWEGEEDE